MSAQAATRQYIRHLALLLVIPLVLTSTGYALFSQQLSINTTTSNPNYTISNSMVFTYTSTISTQGQSYVHDFTGTIENQGTADVDLWQVLFDMPADFSSFSCQNTVVCSNVSNRAEIDNGASNGTITPGNSVTFTFTFKTGLASYTLQNVSVAGTVQATYQQISGLTVGYTRGAYTKIAGKYYWPYTFTVTNNTGSSISAWRIRAPWNTATDNYITYIDSTVNYVAGATELTFLSTSGMADSTTFQFNTTLGAKVATWAYGGEVIEGLP